MPEADVCNSPLNSISQFKNKAFNVVSDRLCHFSFVRSDHFVNDGDKLIEAAVQNHLFFSINKVQGISHDR